MATPLNNVHGIREGKIDWPFALREFAEWQGMTSPLKAAEKAAGELLEEYADGAASSSVVSVTRLCDILGISLHGTKPTARRSSLRLADIAPSRARMGRAKLSFRDERPTIEVHDAHFARARLSVAHEIGHYLIHRRGSTVDWMTLRSTPTQEEEIIAEYIGRLLLLPRKAVDLFFVGTFDATKCLELASRFRISIHAAACRLVDPDQTDGGVRGVIFWSMRHHVDRKSDSARAFAPDWHLCPGCFVPVGACHIRHDSLLASVALSPEERKSPTSRMNMPDIVRVDDRGTSGDAQEDVSIGSFRGRFMVKAFAWGDVQKRTRKVLSVFQLPNC